MGIFRFKPQTRRWWYEAVEISRLPGSKPAEDFSFASASSCSFLGGGDWQDFVRLCHEGFFMPSNQARFRAGCEFLPRAEL